MSLLDLINQQRAKLQRSTKERPEKLNSEKNVVRFLIGEVDGLPQLQQDWGQHFIKDQSGALKAVYICTQTNFDEPCAVCEAIAQGTAMTSDEDLLKVLKDARSSKRILVNALYTSGGKHENAANTPVVLDLPPSVWDSVLATAQAFAEEGVNIFDPKEGHNFIIEKTGSGMNTEYKVTPSPRASAIPAGVMEKVKDLAQWARQESEADKAKAITSVRVITGNMEAVATGRPALAAPAPKAPSRLAHVEAIDADFEEVPATKTSAAADADLDEFLNGL